jgi:hypothetical protein
VLQSPSVVPIFFPGDPDRAAIESFLGKMKVSQYWASTGVSEYGVGAWGGASSREMTEAAPASLTESQVKAWIKSKLESPDWGSVGTGDILTVFFPPGTVLTSDMGYPFCQPSTAGGYHGELTLGSGQKVVFAAIGRCTAWSDPFAGVTFVASHEWLEASTNPFPETAPAYYGLDADHLIWWAFPIGGENADLCEFNTSIIPSDLGYRVSRSWSNASGRMGHDPCLPSGSTSYFNAAPVLDEPVTLISSGARLPTKGIQIALGASRTVDVELFSDLPTSGPWQLAAYDVSEMMGGPKNLQLTLDKTSGKNGDRVHLTILPLRAGELGGAEFVVTSTLSGQTNLWFGFVAN